MKGIYICTLLLHISFLNFIYFSKIPRNVVFRHANNSFMFYSCTFLNSIDWKVLLVNRLVDKFTLLHIIWKLYLYPNGYSPVVIMGFIFLLHLLHTVYTVHLMVILIWQFSEFVFICQINCTHSLYLYVSMIFLCDLDKPCCQTKHLPIYIIYQFAKHYVHQMYRIYGMQFDASYG